MSSKNFNSKTSRGWVIAKNSWSVINSAKSLLLIPVFGFLINAALLVCLFAFGFRTEVKGGLYDFGIYPQFDLISIISIIAYYFLANIVNVFLAGVASHNILARLEANPTSIASSFKAALKKRRPLLAFSLINSLIGYSLATIAEKLPFAGRIAVWFSEASWTAASFFAIPIIMHRKEKVSSKMAIAESAKALKSLWKEGVTSQLSIGFVFLIVVAILYALLVIITRIIYVTVDINTGAAMAIIVGSLLVLIFVILTFNLMGLIARCALYRYQVTGEDPENYNLSVLRAGMTVSKARKLF